ncbi:TetR/AcrR family transcriptional regulator [Sinosporangium siamense]|uniref:HTH tetR-type domain-containing protein n=1 Tax=Sinosporangium siamense TaxID=1367973 RepID=A0A919RQD5_9ACTN|nr:TetR/AcrR family transcriptional regulator [Sinosporangium siamense]GII97347.1 hypothetical protein Ssi02_75780 [Sinosporangium siamense]
MAAVPDPQDLTARARIREAALRHFGEEGFERATIRAIAETADVSPGLVRHHFGSKDGLREACDEQLVKLLRHVEREAHTYRAGDLGRIHRARAELAPYWPYMARALAEGRAAPLFDEMVRLSELWLEELDASSDAEPLADRRSRAVVATAMSLSIVVLRQHVSRALGVEMPGADADLLISKAMFDFYSRPLIGPEDAARLAAALDRLGGGASPRSDPPA